MSSRFENLRRTTRILGVHTPRNAVVFPLSEPRPATTELRGKNEEIAKSKLNFLTFNTLPLPLQER